MRFLLVCVNYNSYNALERYLQSVDQAAGAADNVEVEMLVADNSSCLEPFSTDRFAHLKATVIPCDNLGYLGTAQKILNSRTDLPTFDYVAISNVDLQLGKEFFLHLQALPIEPDVAQIAPRIWSSSMKRDINPKILSRYSPRRLKLLLLMYRIPLLFYLYHSTLNKRKKFTNPKEPMEIYAAHGAFILLTKQFFKTCPQIDYPVFLYGEELYLAEQIRNAGMKVCYRPQLYMDDSGHVSTSTLKRKQFFQYNQDSLKYILQTYYG